MARARTKTLLPLDTWAEIVGLDPRHFNQVTTAALPNTSCSAVVKQYAWQESGQVAREDIAQAIAHAERQVTRELGYTPVPDWIVDERVRTVQPGIPDVINKGQADARGFAMPAFLAKKHFITGGIEAKTLIEAGADMAYTDEDGDGYLETATVIVATTVTDPAEIAVYYPGENGRDEWEIRPLNDPLTRRRSVTIAGGNATIVMASEQLVDANLLAALNPAAVDGDVASNFNATVDVFRHFNDPQTQVTLMWLPTAQFCDCGTTGCVTCAHTVQTGCFVSRDLRNSIINFSAATWNATTEAFDTAVPTVSRIPENLRAFYYAGFQDLDHADAPRLEMDPDLARHIAYLSLLHLPRPVCSCDAVKTLFADKRTDLALRVSTQAASQSYQLSPRHLNNPWGTQRAAIEAWSFLHQGDVVVGQAVSL
jgi:hypothetical protein